MRPHENAQIITGEAHSDTLINNYLLLAIANLQDQQDLHQTPTAVRDSQGRIRNPVHHALASMRSGHQCARFTLAAEPCEPQYNPNISLCSGIIWTHALESDLQVHQWIAPLRTQLSGVLRRGSALTAAISHTRADTPNL